LSLSFSGLTKSSRRNPPQDEQRIVDLKVRIKAIAHERKRFGYRLIHDMLRFEGIQVNQNCVYRLYEERQIAVNRRKKAKIPLAEHRTLFVPDNDSQVWSIVMNILANGIKGFPQAIRTDGGCELTSRVFMGWMHTNDVEHLLIQSGKPT
jgi:putative transposase